jgi:PKD repeat protein
VSANGNCSTASGGISSWAWAWGDGQAGSGSTATHAYAGGGSYSVALTVTDTSGSAATSTQTVNVQAPPPPAQPAAPTACFASTPSGLSVSVDGGCSTGDGGLASWAWDWGDGTAAGAGRVASHPYASAGTRTITLTVTDSRGATASTSRSVAVQAPQQQPQPAPPTACFTVTASGLTTSVDGACSSDPDGSVAAWAWDWGDGSPLGAGQAASHAYATGGAKTVQLTVKDNAGLAGSTSRGVTLTAPPTSPDVDWAGVVKTVPSILQGFLPWETSPRFAAAPDYGALATAGAKGVLIRAANGDGTGSYDKTDFEPAWGKRAPDAQKAGLEPVAWTYWYGPSEGVAGDVKAYLQACARYTAQRDAAMSPPTLAWVIDAEDANLPGLGEALATLSSLTHKPVFVAPPGNPRTFAGHGLAWDFATVNRAVAGWMPQLYSHAWSSGSMTIERALAEWDGEGVPRGSLFPILDEVDPAKVAQVAGPMKGTFPGISFWWVGNAQAGTVAAYVKAWTPPFHVTGVFASSADYGGAIHAWVKLNDGATLVPAGTYKLHWGLEERHGGAETGLPFSLAYVLNGVATVTRGQPLQERLFFKDYGGDLTVTLAQPATGVEVVLDVPEALSQFGAAPNLGSALAAPAYMANTLVVSDVGAQDSVASPLAWSFYWKVVPHLVVDCILDSLHQALFTAAFRAAQVPLALDFSKEAGKKVFEAAMGAGTSAASALNDVLNGGWLPLESALLQTLERTTGTDGANYFATTVVPSLHAVASTLGTAAAQVGWRFLYGLLSCGAKLSFTLASWVLDFVTVLLQRSHLDDFLRSLNLGQFFRALVGDVMVVQSPMDIVAYDASGQTSGLQNGQVLTQIPDSSVLLLGEKKVVRAPDGAVQRVELRGTGTGETHFSTNVGTAGPVGWVIPTTPETRAWANQANLTQGRLVVQRLEAPAAVSAGSTIAPPTEAPTTTAAPLHTPWTLQPAGQPPATTHPAPATGLWLAVLALVGIGIANRRRRA